MHLTDKELELSDEYIDGLPDGGKKAALYILCGLEVEGEKHKQFYLEQAAEALGVEIAAVNAWLNDHGGYELEPGTAP